MEIYAANHLPLAVSTSAMPSGSVVFFMVFVTSVFSFLHTGRETRGNFTASACNLHLEFSMVLQMRLKHHEQDMPFLLQLTEQLCQCRQTARNPLQAYGEGMKTLMQRLRQA